MKTTIVAMLMTVAAALAAPQAWAGPQQDKMKACNAEAKDKNLAGDERKAHMKQCLSAKPVDKKAAQQEKMKTCNADAKTKNLAGDDRKKFMKECLSA